MNISLAVPLATVSLCASLQQAEPNVVSLGPEMIISNPNCINLDSQVFSLCVVGELPNPVSPPPPSMWEEASGFHLGHSPVHSCLCLGLARGWCTQAYVTFLFSHFFGCLNLAIPALILLACLCGDTIHQPFHYFLLLTLGP